MKRAYDTFPDDDLVICGGGYFDVVTNQGEEPLEAPTLYELLGLDDPEDEADADEENYAANSGGEAPLHMPTLEDIFG